MKWKFEEHWSGEFARWSEGKVSALARDCDGDFAYWSVKIGGEVFAEGECHDRKSFDTEMKCAEKSVIEALGAG